MQQVFVQIKTKTKEAFTNWVASAILLLVGTLFGGVLTYVVGLSTFANTIVPRVTSLESNQIQINQQLHGIDTIVTDLKTSFKDSSVELNNKIDNVTTRINTLINVLPKLAQ